MDNQLVSICCITYNHSLYIKDCLDGFIMQKCDFDFEILIYDDASTDNTAEIIKEYEKKYPNLIKPVYQTENQWSQGFRMIQSTYNFSRAKGKYIALCEGDDYWTDPLKLQKQVDFLEGNAEYVIHSGRAQILRGSILKELIGNPLSKNSYILSDFYTRNNLITCTIMFRNVHIPKYSFKGLIFGDWMLYVLLLSQKSGSMAFVTNEPYSIYRIHQGGVMQTIAKKNDNAEAHLKQIEFINKYMSTKYTKKDINTINDYCISIFEHNIKISNYKACLNTVMRNVLLVELSLPVRNYLGLINHWKFQKHHA